MRVDKTFLVHIAYKIMKNKNQTDFCNKRENSNCSFLLRYLFYGKDVV